MSAFFLIHKIRFSFEIGARCARYFRQPYTTLRVDALLFFFRLVFNFPRFIFAYFVLYCCHWRPTPIDRHINNNKKIDKKEHLREWFECNVVRAFAYLDFVYRHPCRHRSLIGCARAPPNTLNVTTVVEKQHEYRRHHHQTSQMCRFASSPLCKAISKTE